MYVGERERERERANARARERACAGNVSRRIGVCRNTMEQDKLW